MDEEADVDSLIWGRIIEQFFLDLVDEGFLIGCEECNFPTPAVFKTNGMFLCRQCRNSGDVVGV